MDYEDIAQITQVLSLYAHVADWLNKGDPAVEGESLSVRSVFTEDAVFDFAGSKYIGAETIATLFVATPTIHQTSDAYVFQDGEHVRAHSKFSFTDLTTGKSMWGDYRDLLQRTTEGWRIRERVVHVRNADT
jgi:SnoaL-like domain